MNRFVKEFARYTQAQIIGGFDGLTKEEKDARILRINRALSALDRGLFTVNETMFLILRAGGCELE